MKLPKTIFLLLFLPLLIVNSCKKEPKIVQLKTIKGTFPTMIAFDNDLPKLTPSFINSKKNEIDRFYKKNWADDSMNGGFLVAKNGQIIYEKYQGIANFDKQTPITSTTPIQIASVSKVLTATAILKLIDAGKIDLNQKLNTILDGFPFPDITLKTLLNHRSGLRNYAYFTMDKNVWDSQKILTNQDVLNLLINKKIDLEFPTDTKFSYCNTNYAMLALVIEKITGLKYPEAMKKMIFEPLQMKNTYVFEFDKDKDSATPSYKGNFIKIQMDFLDAVYGDKNIYSTPRDLLKLDLARHSTHFLNPDLEAQIYKGYSNEHIGTKNYGLGIRMINWQTGQHFYFHNGWWHGNTSSFVSMGKEKVSIICLSNKFTHTTYKVRNLLVLFGDYPFRINDSI